MEETKARAFNKAIQKHIVSMSVSYVLENKPNVAWLSGFLLGIPVGNVRWLVWMTAGHVMHDLDNLLRSSQVRGMRVTWHDNFPHKDAQNIPCDYSSLHKIPIEMDGYDFGLISLAGFHAAPIMHARENQPLTEHHWTIDGFVGEEHYVVGSPHEFSELRAVRSDGKIVDYSASSESVSVPVTEIDPTIDGDENDFWQHTDNFYGRIIQVHREDGTLLTDMSGMSGGPIFGVRDIDDKHFEYRLIAIQSAWMPGAKTVRGMRFSKIIGVLREAIDRVISEGHRDEQN